MKSNYISPQKLNDVIMCMKYENGLAIRVSNATGLRISDVLAIPYVQIYKSNKITIREKKTAKSRRVYIPLGLWREMKGNANRGWVFPHRLKAYKHRTREAVYIDFKKACRRSGIAPEGLSPHSVRKAWAVREYARTRSIVSIQRKMNHRDAGTTALYALSDKL